MNLAVPGSLRTPWMIVKRLAAVPLVMLALATMVFIAMRMLPGSPATSLAVGGGAASQSTAEEIAENEARINEALG